MRFLSAGFGVLVLAVAFLSVGLPAEAQLDIQLDEEEAAVLKLVNNYREQRGLVPLVHSAALTRSAKLHSRAMAETDCYGHHCPGEPSPRQRFIDAGYPAQTVLISENLAAGHRVKYAHWVFNAWRASPAHNFNMLQPTLRAMGIGRYYDPNSAYQWYWTLELAGGMEGAGNPHGPVPPKITTESLPPTRRSLAYNVTISAAAGTPPYRWKTQGLPAGLQSRPYGLRGRSLQIFGRAWVSGTFQVIATVTDARGLSDSQSLVLEVTPCCRDSNTTTIATPLLHNGNFVIFDQQGRSVVAADALPHLPNGTHFYVIEVDGNRRVIQKLVVLR